MTLVKTKSKAPTHHRKLSAGHHRKNDKYLKTYWPYIPIVLVLGGAVAANAYLPASLSSASSNAQYSARIDSIMGANNSFILDLMYLALTALVVWYLVRHFKRLRSLVLKSEQYLARHYVMDIALGMLIGGLFILVN